MKRLAIDTNILNRIADTFGLLDQILDAAGRSGFSLVCPYVVKDELTAASDPARRARMLEIYEALLKVEPPVCGTF